MPAAKISRNAKFVAVSECFWQKWRQILIASVISFPLNSSEWRKFPKINSHDQDQKTNFFYGLLMFILQVPQSGFFFIKRYGNIKLGICKKGKLKKGWS